MFQELQEALASLLRATPQLDAVSDVILTRKESDVDAIVKEIVTEGSGVSIVVLYPFPTKVFNGLRGLACKEIGVQIQVVENVQSNSTGLSCLQIAEFIHRAAQLWPPGTDGIGNSCLVCEENNPWKDPQTIGGRNEIVLFFKIGGIAQPIDANFVPSLGINYRFQNDLYFQLLDYGADPAAFVAPWAALIAGVAVPVLPDNDDLDTFSGNAVAKTMGGNFRFNGTGLWLYSPNQDTWYQLAAQSVAGVVSPYLGQAGDGSFLASGGWAPLTPAGANWRISNAGLLELFCPTTNLWHELYVNTVAGVKTLLLNQTGEA